MAKVVKAVRRKALRTILRDPELAINIDGQTPAAEAVGLEFPECRGREAPSILVTQSQKIPGLKNK